MSTNADNRQQTMMNGEATPQAAAAPRRPARRGFAAMSPERQREIARKGGRAAHRAGTAHEFTPEEARAAGRKGGLAAHRNDRPQQPATTETATTQAAPTETVTPEETTTPSEVPTTSSENGNDKQS